MARCVGLLLATLWGVLIFKIQTTGRREYRNIRVPGRVALRIQNYSPGLYGITVRLPRDCWSEWLVMPQGYTPYVMDISGFSQTGYEIYPAHKGNVATASNTGRVPFTQHERAAFQSIRFQAGFIAGNSRNVVKLLFTKP